MRYRPLYDGYICTTTDYRPNIIPQIVDIKQSRIKTFRTVLISLQHRKEQISKLSQEMIEQNSSILNLILDCQHTRSTLSEEIKNIDDVVGYTMVLSRRKLTSLQVRQENARYETQMGELQTNFEMELRSVQTKVHYLI